MLRSLREFSPLLLFAGVASAGRSLYVATGTTPARSFELLISLGFTWAVIAWIMGDIRRRRLAPCHEFGFLVAVTLPVSLIWYLFWTRGWKGAGVLVTMMGVAFLPSLVATGIWIALRS